MMAAFGPPSAAEERCREMARLNPYPRYLFCKALTAVSISLAAVSDANVTIADIDLRSVAAVPDGGRMRTPSTVRFAGMRALITAGDVDGGSCDRCTVGLAAARSAALMSLISIDFTSSSSFI
jgi:hypothetical protein